MNVNIVNTCIPLLERAKSLAGGRFNTLRDNRPNHAPIMTLYFRVEEQKTLLKEILPHLIAKRRHAELYLEARELMEMYRGLGHTKDLTDIRDKRMEAIYWELRKLNARGRNGPAEVEDEIAQLASDPRLYTQEMFDEEMSEVLRTREQRIKENKLRRSRDWKRRNKAKMAAYWKEWSARQKVSA